MNYWQPTFHHVTQLSCTKKHLMQKIATYKEEKSIDETQSLVAAKAST